MYNAAIHKKTVLKLSDNERKLSSEAAVYTV